ncbi:hypothetical protein [Actinomadura atramentaria]|uniref:hypothetical protein n=1 Tax=Actinomadura atramentaria TaxID=1990 RepID=UPI00036E492A|nr:hypothetical protein [Actinomadura atramentaria]
MISYSVARAVTALQRQALASRDTYELDRIDRALDELLRNPTDASTPAQHRIRSAMGHAYEALQRRRAIAPLVALNPERADHGRIDTCYLTVEILVWLHAEPGLASAERALLNDLARGHDATSIAHHLGVPLPRMRERISRARRHARTLWRKAETAA